uniref:Uncharacterized protein n=1 Tax=Tanacetum cinerariifolium TaxID=118510 RepID=A0A6L2MG22_TANCI|nr:hypothetical protein [Tanacetum cinerariifolium]
MLPSMSTSTRWCKVIPKKRKLPHHQTLLTRTLLYLGHHYQTSPLPGVTPLKPPLLLSKKLCDSRTLPLSRGFFKF